jgi:dTDP-4-dehydrorhamnose 3,5-epimerase
MRFEPTPLAGVFVVEIEPVHDNRGFFASLFDAGAFRARGLTAVVAQSSLSLNRVRGTLRGMHYQRPPAAEAKLVRCIRGAIFDVAVDLRAGSPTHLRWTSCELSAGNRRALYIPEGCAHGFQTLEDDTEVLYHVSHAYAPALADGVHYQDPAIDITWPLAVSELSERDTSWPLLPVPLRGEGR